MGWRSSVPGLVYDLYGGGGFDQQTLEIPRLAHQLYYSMCQCLHAVELGARSSLPPERF